MKVAWFDAEDWHEEFVDSEHEIVFFRHPLRKSDLDDSFDAVSVFVDSEVDREFIELVRPEKVLCRSSGYDNVDLEAAEEFGVEVCNVPDYGSDTVAEYTFALLLDIAKNIDEDLGKDPNSDSGLQGFELKGKTLGVIGAGNIGKEVIRRARAFEMEVVAYDPYPDEDAAMELGYSYVGLEELLRVSGFVSINCPLNDSTRHLLSEEEFDVADGLMLVNTARGAIIDSEALFQALKDGRVKHAALDVVEEGWFERLSELENVCFTPHNAYNTREADERIVELTLENLDKERSVI